MFQDCLACGACCAGFRVSFYWGETDMHPDGIVPDALTMPISPYHVCMRGTEKKPPRCIALVGEVGRAVTCSIYTQRSSTCREFEAGTEDCNKARSLHGLPMLAQRKLS